MACTHTPPVPGFLRDKQISYHLSISRSTWWRWVAEGIAPAPIRLGENTTVWRTKDVEAFIATRSAEAANDC